MNSLFISNAFYFQAIQIPQMDRNPTSLLPQPTFFHDIPQIWSWVDTDSISKELVKNFPLDSESKAILLTNSTSVSSVAQSCPTLCDPMDSSTPGFPGNHHLLFKLMSIKSVIPSNHLILCRPLLLLPSIFSSIKVFSSESILYIRWPKYWSFSFSISPFNQYWISLLGVKDTH